MPATNILPSNEKEEIDRIISKYIDNDLTVLWSKISKDECLSINFIRRYKKKLDWNMISKYRPMDFKFIEEFKDYIVASKLLENEHISDEFLYQIGEKDYFKINHNLTGGNKNNLNAILPSSKFEVTYPEFVKGIPDIEMKSVPSAIDGYSAKDYIIKTAPAIPITLSSKFETTPLKFTTYDIVGFKKIKENSIMSEDPLSLIKQDAPKAAYRIASSQLINIVSNALILLIESQNSNPKQLSAISKFLASDPGRSFIQYVAGICLQYIPKLKDNQHCVLLSKELRIDSITGIGSFLTDKLLSEVVSIIQSNKLRVEDLEEPEEVIMEESEDGNVKVKEVA